MKRPLLVWLVFAGCTLTGLAVLGWFSAEMLRLERGATQAREIAAREESVRLALWRMDSALASIHGLEAARPPSEYAPFLRAGTTFTRDLAPASPETVMLPSPLLGFTPPFVHLHVQVEDSGNISSPQAPEGAAYFAALRAREPAGQFLAALEGPQPLAGARGDANEDHRDQTALEFAADNALAAQPAAAEPQSKQLAPQAERLATQELRKSQAEQQQRAELASESYYNVATLPEQRARVGGLERKLAADAEAEADAAAAAAGEKRKVATFSEPTAVSSRAAAPAGSPIVIQDLRDEAKLEGSIGTDELTAGPILAVWIGGDLFFVRRAEGNGGTRVQAVWLDWPELRAWLLARVTDLLPAASLEPAAAATPFTADDASRRLAFLPVHLRPGAVVTALASSWSPLKVSLTIAWGLAVVGVIALALLLAGTLQLSERRGAFVSAVTHELRTPLTTFRMYTEMLAGGMVPDEGRRRSYLDTLRKEAERLSHLVENVLSYARLERGRASRRIEDTTPGTLFGRIEERLRLRAEQGGLALAVEFAAGAAELPLRTDTTAFEQIIFNLVDNAAKYARRADGAGGALTISAARGAGGRLVVRVSDNGPGIAAGVRRRLFQPFSKSAAEAAHSQPGVGLGLALSRRLARDELHGELALERTGPEGTVFRLEV